MEPTESSTPASPFRRRGRPRKNPVPPENEPPHKRRRFGGTSTLFSNSHRPSRRHTEGPGANTIDRIVTPLSRLRQSGEMRFSSAAAAASAISQSENYKPREERSWEEFHPDLGLDAILPVFNAEDVDGPKTPSSSAVAIMDSFSNPSINSVNRTPGQYLVTPIRKRGPGRPPKRPEAVLMAMGIPSPTLKPVPTPLQNPKEKLVLPKPSYRKINTFDAYEKVANIGVNYVDRAFANAGYQESELYVQPRTLYRSQNSLQDEHELFFSLKSLDGSSHNHHNSHCSNKVRVEYDMDEQDERWLEALNIERSKTGAEAIKPQHFEIAMTLIEKEWHALERQIPKSQSKAPQTHRPRSNSAAAVNGEAIAGEELDSKCAVCDDGDCENTNAIVFCDGCDLAVHQECYGVPFIPEGQWLCRKCQLIGRSSSASTVNNCIFCPNTEGAFKQTTNMKWAHLLCALWIPEVSIGNQTFMEPIQDVEKVPKQRWKLTCYICQQKMGACIQCSNKNCYLAFHVTCARRCRLQLQMKNPHGGGMIELSRLKGYCDKHVSLEWQQEHNVDQATSEAKNYYRREFKNRHWADSQLTALSTAELNSSHTGPGASADSIFIGINSAGSIGTYKSTTLDGDKDSDDILGDASSSAMSMATDSNKQALLKKIWRLPSGAPIIPHLVYKNVDTHFAKYTIGKKKDFLIETCKYWTLKREARRGACLLKRLQLQLELFSSMEMTRRNFAAMGAAGGPKLQQRIDFALALKGDMDQIRKLCEQTQEMELLKFQDVELLRTIIDTVYFPLTPLLWPILEKAEATCSTSTSRSNTSLNEHLQSTRQKSAQRFYTSVTVFANDFLQALNAFVYSTTDTEEPQTKPVSEQLNAVELKVVHKDAQKERLQRAKRILKSVTSDLLKAVRAEADLLSQSHEDAEIAMNTLLEHALEPRHSPILTISKTDVSGLVVRNHSHYNQNNVHDEHSTHSLQILNNHNLLDNAKSDTTDLQVNQLLNGIHRHKSPPLLPPHSHSNSNSHLPDQTPSLFSTTQPALDQDSLQKAANARVTPASSNAPALSVDSSNHSGTSNDQEPEPLTPSSRDKVNYDDIQAITTNPAAELGVGGGGIPWYMVDFEAQGTTIHEPPATPPPPPSPSLPPSPTPLQPTPTDSIINTDLTPVPDSDLQQEDSMTYQSQIDSNDDNEDDEEELHLLKMPTEQTNQTNYTSDLSDIDNEALNDLNLTNNHTIPDEEKEEEETDRPSKRKITKTINKKSPSKSRSSTRQKAREKTLSSATSIYSQTSNHDQTPTSTVADGGSAGGGSGGPAMTRAKTRRDTAAATAAAAAAARKKRAAKTRRSRW